MSTFSIFSSKALNDLAATLKTPNPRAALAPPDSLESDPISAVDDLAVDIAEEEEDLAPTQSLNMSAMNGVDEDLPPTQLLDVPPEPIDEDVLAVTRATDSSEISDASDIENMSSSSSDANALNGLESDEEDADFIVPDSESVSSHSDHATPIRDSVSSEDPISGSSVDEPSEVAPINDATPPSPQAVTPVVPDDPTPEPVVPLTEEDLVRHAQTTYQQHENASTKTVRRTRQLSHDPAALDVSRYASGHCLKDIPEAFAAVKFDADDFRAAQEQRKSPTRSAASVDALRELGNLHSLLALLELESVRDRTSPTGKAWRASESSDAPVGGEKDTQHQIMHYINTYRQKIKDEMPSFFALLNTDDDTQPGREILAAILNGYSITCHRRLRIAAADTSLPYPKCAYSGEVLAEGDVVLELRLSLNWMNGVLVARTPADLHGNRPFERDPELRTFRVYLVKQKYAPTTLGLFVTTPPTTSAALPGDKEVAAAVAAPATKKRARTSAATPPKQPSPAKRAKSSASPKMPTTKKQTKKKKIASTTEKRARTKGDIPAKRPRKRRRKEVAPHVTKYYLSSANQVFIREHALLQTLLAIRAKANGSGREHMKSLGDFGKDLLLLSSAPTVDRAAIAGLCGEYSRSHPDALNTCFAVLRSIFVTARNLPPDSAPDTLTMYAGTNGTARVASTAYIRTLANITYKQKILVATKAIVDEVIDSPARIGELPDIAYTIPTLLTILDSIFPSLV